MAGKGWDVWRGFVGLLFVAAAAGNFAFTLWNPDPLFDFLAEDVSLWPFDELMVNLIAPNAALFVFVAVLFELALGYWCSVVGDGWIWVWLRPWGFSCSLSPI